jgi:thiol-disulfide isomerase/thioredoxin
MAGLLAAAALASATAACSTPSAGSGDTGYITGDGVVTTVAAADRQEVPVVRGKGLDGATVDVAAHRGRVVVVNVWAHWCPPCRAEAPALSAAARQLPNVTFIGIDTREDNKAAALAFIRAYRVPYDSIYDPDGTAVLAFYGMLSPNSLPSTMVIDKQGRIAALVRGPVDTTTLVGLVHDVSLGT